MKTVKLLSLLSVLEEGILGVDRLPSFRHQLTTSSNRDLALLARSLTETLSHIYYILHAPLKPGLELFFHTSYCRTRYAHILA